VTAPPLRIALYVPALAGGGAERAAAVLASQVAGERPHGRAVAAPEGRDRHGRIEEAAILRRVEGRDRAPAPHRALRPGPRRGRGGTGRGGARLGLPGARPRRGRARGP
jgi:hypothetical protein